MMHSNVRNICPDCVTDERRKFQENMPTIEIGDYVKATFSRADGATESMWFQVGEITEDTFGGASANDPVIVNLKEGDPVRVLKSEIWDILKPKDL